MRYVKDIMTTEVLTIAPDDDVTQAARLLLERRINGLPVVDKDGRVVGIICQSDLIAQQKRLPVPSVFTFLDGIFPLQSGKAIEKQLQKIAAITVAQAMTRNPVTVSPDTTLETVAALMVDNSFHTLPVVDADRRLVGIVGKEDVLRTLIPGSGA